MVPSSKWAGVHRENFEMENAGLKDKIVAVILIVSSSLIFFPAIIILIYLVVSDFVEI